MNSWRTTRSYDFHIQRSDYMDSTLVSSGRVVFETFHGGIRDKTEDMDESLGLMSPSLSFSKPEISLTITMWTAVLFIDYGGRLVIAFVTCR